MPTEEEEEDYPIFIRASGECICEKCKKPYRKHPPCPLWLDWDKHPYLRELCDGTLVKL